MRSPLAVLLLNPGRSPATLPADRLMAAWQVYADAASASAPSKAPVDPH